MLTNDFTLIRRYCDDTTWNSLPPTVINSDTLSVFKSRLKTHLFNASLPAPPAPLKLRHYIALYKFIIIIMFVR